MARVAIVTGGTRGIGEAISIALKDMGMKVAANYAGNDERAREFTERTGIKSSNGMLPTIRRASVALPKWRPSSGQSTCWSTMPESRATRP